jgi:hypothetical protein
MFHQAGTIIATLNINCSIMIYHFNFINCVCCAPNLSQLNNLLHPSGTKMNIRCTCWLYYMLVLCRNINTNRDIDYWSWRFIKTQRYWLHSTCMQIHVSHFLNQFSGCHIRQQFWYRLWGEAVSDQHTFYTVCMFRCGAKEVQHVELLRFVIFLIGDWFRSSQVIHNCGLPHHIGDWSVPRGRGSDAAWSKKISRRLFCAVVRSTCHQH